MKTIFAVVILMIISFPALLFANSYRIYCKTDGVTIEHRPDQNYVEGNAKMKDVTWFVINAGSMPKYEYLEQLKCEGDSLSVDTTFKPDWVVRQEELKQAQTALDAELGKAEPDVITVLRLQRSIELLESGKNGLRINK